MNNEGDAGIAELKRLLMVSEDKLREAMAKIGDLEGVVSADEKEKTRLNKEIERLNNILKATNENLSEMERKSTDKIRQLGIQIQDLEGQIEKLKKEKLQEISKAEKAKTAYEAKIADLESQIAMLKD